MGAAQWHTLHRRDGYLPWRSHRSRRAALYPARDKTRAVGSRAAYPQLGFTPELVQVSGLSVGRLLPDRYRDLADKRASRHVRPPKFRMESSGSSSGSWFQHLKNNWAILAECHRSELDLPTDGTIYRPRVFTGRMRRVSGPSSILMPTLGCRAISGLGVCPGRLRPRKVEHRVPRRGTGASVRGGALVPRGRVGDSCHHLCSRGEPAAVLRTRDADHGCRVGGQVGECPRRLGRAGVSGWL